MKEQMAYHFHQHQLNLNQQFLILCPLKALMMIYDVQITFHDILMQKTMKFQKIHIGCLATGGSYLYWHCCGQ